MTKKKLFIIASIVCFSIAAIIFFIPINGYSLMDYWFSTGGKLVNALGLGDMVPGIGPKKAFFFIFLIGGIGSLIGKHIVED